jgi:hypothetical protein
MDILGSRGFTALVPVLVLLQNRDQFQIPLELFKLNRFHCVNSMKLYSTQTNYLHRFIVAITTLVKIAPILRNRLIKLKNN